MTRRNRDTHMADRGLMTNIPIWVRVPGIIALVLVGIVVGSMLLGGSSGMDGMEHDGGQTGPAAPAGNPTPSHVRPNH